jgi:hypothetical protein
MKPGPKSIYRMEGKSVVRAPLTMDDGQECRTRFNAGKMHRKHTREAEECAA